jgi:hypothetical protein
MTRAAQRRLSVLAALLALLAVVAAGLGPARAVEQPSVSSTVAVSAGAPGLQPAGLVDTRLQRGAGAGQSEPTPHQPWFSGRSGPDRCPNARAAARAGVPDRAVRPRPGPPTCLRGPPGPSA